MSTTITSVKEFLKIQAIFLKNQNMTPLHGWQGGYHGFVYHHALEFEWKPLPDDVKPGDAQQCFRNAFELTKDQPERFIYCEGFAAGIIPVMHAWCIDRETQTVVDVTWSGGHHEEQGRDYFGIPFNWRYAVEATLNREYYGIIDDWQNDWPVLKEPVENFLNEWVN